MSNELNSSDVFFDKQLPAQFEPFFFKWEHSFTSLEVHAEIDSGFFAGYSPGDEGYEQFCFLDKDMHIYQSPSVPNGYALMDSNKVMFMHKTGDIDFPSIHRFMGPALYTVEDSTVKDLRWFLQNKEYTEFDYWTLMCQMFSDRLQMCLSGDECRFYIENDRYDLPFPNRLNLPISDLNRCDDELRTEVSGHVVWSLKGQEYVSSEKYWFHWENKGMDLNQLL
jgi:hypothetical protein